MDSLNVLLLGQDDTAIYKTIDHSLEALQREVDGLIETIGLRPSLHSRALVGLANEEGTMQEGLFLNPFSLNVLRPPEGVRLLMGNVLIVRTEGAEFASLTELDVQVLNKLLQDVGVLPELADA